MAEITILTGDERLDEICTLEALCFSDPWSREAFESAVASGLSRMLGATEDGRLVGYALLQCIGDDAELLNLAVTPTERGRGLGRALLDACFAEALVQGADRLFLEVRASNVAALRLYEHAGFARFGIRRGYYTHPREDAVLMSRPLVCRDSAD